MNRRGFQVNRACRQRSADSAGRFLAFVTFTALFAGLALLSRYNIVPLAVPAIYASLSLLLFGMYGWDKSAAKSGSQRTAEATLHLLGLAGGWPGALLAQQVFRHKTQKQPFRLVFWCAVASNCAALVWLVYLNGSG